MISVKIKSRCGICGFEVEWLCYENEYGFFQIPDAYCPNDFCMLDQVIDGRDAREMYIKRVIEKTKKDKKDDN